MIFSQIQVEETEKPLFIAKTIDEYLNFCSIVGNKDPIDAMDGLEQYREGVREQCKLTDEERKKLIEINNAVNNGTIVNVAVVNIYKNFLENVSIKLQRISHELSLIGETNQSGNVELANVKRLYGELNYLDERNNGLGGVVEANKKLALANSHPTNGKINNGRDYKSISSIDIIPIDYIAKNNNKNYDDKMDIEYL